MRILIFIGSCFVALMPFQMLSAQDTVRVSVDEFIQRGMNNAEQLDAERQKVNLAHNRIRQTQSKRFLPEFQLNTQHGVVPGVKSDRDDLDPNEYYLDPNLDNDWENWAIFTRAKVEAVQPVFTWGALKNAVHAAQSGAEAAEQKFQITKADTELRLFKLYQSYLLSLEIQRLVHDARKQLNKIDDKLEESRKEGSDNFDESDLFKFKVFKSTFASRVAEVKENAKYVQRVWNYVLQAKGSTVFMPKNHFLDPVQNPIKEISFYKRRALGQRPEIKALNAGINAADYGVKATRAKSLPSLFLGISGSYANTPNRPRQSNPFIINNSNYASARVGFGIRQNLDFFSVKYDIKESKLKRKRAEYSKSAAMDGIALEINQKYKDASVDKIKIDKTNDALVTSKQWVRQEQLDYDLDRGDPKDLIDALKQELELKLQNKQQIFNFNKDMAELFKSAALPVRSLKTGY